MKKKKNNFRSSCLIVISTLILLQGLSAWKAIGAPIPNDGNSIHVLESSEMQNGIVRKKLYVTEQTRFLRRVLLTMQNISKDKNHRNVLAEVGGISKSHTSTLVLGTKEAGVSGTDNSSESQISSGAGTEPIKTEASSSGSGASEIQAQSGVSSEESSQNQSSSSSASDGSSNSATKSSSSSSSSSTDFSGSSDSAPSKYTTVTTGRSSVSEFFVGGAVVVILFGLIGVATSNNVLEKRKKKRDNLLHVDRMTDKNWAYIVDEPIRSGSNCTAASTINCAVATDGVSLNSSTCSDLNSKMLSTAASTPWMVAGSIQLLSSTSSGASDHIDTTDYRRFNKLFQGFTRTNSRSATIENDDNTSPWINAGSIQMLSSSYSDISDHDHKKDYRRFNKLFQGFRRTDVISAIIEHDDSQSYNSAYLA